ncbi:MAG: cob(I)yrinic acid a,c-diamide adenosyltransferase [Fimbriimonas sp.]
MKIYTRTGDDGTTGLLGGDRIGKGSARIAAIGDIDELNAVIGLVRTHAVGSELDSELFRIQNWLFDLGSELACPPGGKFDISAIEDGHPGHLEASMDSMTAHLPPLKAFILPGGCPLAAHLHLARCVCRRAERTLLALHETEPVRESTRRFINRLSDWLFVAARTANAAASVVDIEWQKSEVL